MLQFASLLPYGIAIGSILGIIYFYSENIKMKALSEYNLNQYQIAMEENREFERKLKNLRAREATRINDLKLDNKIRQEKIDALTARLSSMQEYNDPAPEIIKETIRNIIK